MEYTNQVVLLVILSVCQRFDARPTTTGNHFCNRDNEAIFQIIESPCGTSSGVLGDVSDYAINAFDVCTHTVEIRLSLENQILQLLQRQQSEMDNSYVDMLPYFDSGLPLQSSSNVTVITQDLQSHFIELSCLGRAMKERDLFIDENAENELCYASYYLTQELCVLNTASRGRVDSSALLSKTSCQHWPNLDSFQTNLAFVGILNDFRSYLNDLKVRCTQMDAN